MLNQNQAEQADQPQLSLSILLNSIKEKLILHQYEDTIPLLHMIDVALKAEINEACKCDIGDQIFQLLQQCNADETGLDIVLQVLYKLLKAIKEQNVSSGMQFLGNVAWSKLLVESLFSNNWTSISIANSLICLQMFQSISSDNNVVEQLWLAMLANATHPTITPLVVRFVIVQFFDEFSKKINNLDMHIEFLNLIQKLLNSNIRDERKAAYQVLKKFAEAPTTGASQFWNSFVAILENLEENQSHLILPSLNCLKQAEFEKPMWNRWLEIVYTKILSHQNILVTRWALEHCLQSFTCANISEDTLLHFLIAANNTSLYNHEGYFLLTENVCKFLKNDSEVFLLTIAKINWKSVPLHYWLKQVSIVYTRPQMYAHELIFKLAARVRVLQNPFIRQNTIELFEKIFSAAIEAMELAEYIVLVEALYNVMDPFRSITTLTKKLVKRLICNESLAMSPRFYKTVTNNLDNELAQDYQQPEYFNVDRNAKNPCNRNENSFMTCFKNVLEHKSLIHKNDHNWLCLMIVFECENKEVINQFCQLQYNLSLDANESISFEMLKYKWIPSLAQNSAERSFVSEKFVDFFVQLYLKTFSEISNYAVKPEDLLSMGSHKTLYKLSTLLAEHRKVESDAVYNAFLDTLQKYTKRQRLCYNVSCNLIKYCNNVYDHQEAMECIERLLLTDLLNFGICEAVLSADIHLRKDTYMRGLLLGDPKTGDARVEEIYEIEMRKLCPRHLICRKYATSLPKLYRKDILKELIELNNTISCKKPRYFENSMEHRIKVRIALAMLSNADSINDCSFEPALESLLQHNNQLNINYIYEFLAAKCAPSSEVVLNQLENISQFTVSQQVSLMSVTYCYCFLNWSQISNEILQHIINKLLPLTMGANFQTRLYAQLIIYSILEKTCKSNVPSIPGCITIKNAIRVTIGKQINVLLHDARLLLPHIFLENTKQFYDILMYITNAPIDEYSLQLDFKKYQTSRLVFTKKLSSISKQATKPTVADNTEFDVSNIQRKMNPYNDVCAENTLVQAKSVVKSEMFVVASLVEKLPNIGGIARTCDVLGIQNLILSSKLLVEKNEFKSLSMTAEKNLNIIEIRPASLIDFLKQKQAEGYKIIGAEQTVDSKNIVDYRFPKKCILVLGHEKEGVPCHILGLLDYTVEIPQFGIVRSLNVHVTGALFMWEYCKQHIIDK